MNFNSKLKNKHEFFFYLFVAKQLLFAEDNNHILPYQKLTGFMVHILGREMNQKPAVPLMSPPLDEIHI